jgi:3-deoxy-D-manno-octulosonic-acid transferase
MYLIYTALLGMGLVLSLPWYALRFRKYLPTLGERLGGVPASEGAPPLWIHAVSVGELRAAAPLIRRLRAQIPVLPVVVSTNKPTGQEQAREMDEPDRVI